MKNDNLYIGAEGREKLINGIRKCARAVGVTMGTGGSNCLIEAIETPYHYSTNDGATILESIRLSDPLEDMGRSILLEAVKRANKQSGDGSSTTCVVTAAIIEKGLEFVDSHNVMDIKRSLEECIPLIEQSIALQKKDITVDEVGGVCAISAEDTEIAALIQEIYQSIGKDGIIYWDISNTTEDSYVIGNGLTIEGAGFLSPYMSDRDEKTGQFLNSAKLKNVPVLVTRQKVASAGEFDSLFSGLNSEGVSDVIIFCDDIDAGVVGDLIKTRAVRGFRALVIKMPVLWKDQWYEDIAKASGATIIDPQFGLTLKTAKKEHLGTLGHVVVSKDDTFIDGIQDITEHIASIDDGSDDAKNRVARLNMKTARLFIGAHSESALAYKRLKVEDAISAGWQALQGGIVIGGGIALVNASKELPDTIGGTILRSALRAPFRQIIANVGADSSVEATIEEKGSKFGFNTRTGQVEDMYESNIIDPANIVLNAVKNAISVSATALTAPTIVMLPREEAGVYQNQPVVR